MTQSKPTFGAFNKGEVPTIACFNRATINLGVDLDVLIAAMQAYVDNFVAPVWGTPAKLVKTTDFAPNCWAMVFLDDADQPGALAYHDLTPDGWPLSKVFVRTTLQNGDLVSVSASHELVEMLVDPAINIMTTGPDATTIYAYESADPVEELNFPVNGIPMSNFVFPSYFEVFRQPNSSQFDQLKRVSKPFEILAGGYQIIFKDGNWSQVFGSATKQKRFAREDRLGHRSESRSKELVRTNPVEVYTESQRPAPPVESRARQSRSYSSRTPATVVGFETTIKPYFTSCYREHMLFMFDLWSLDDVKSNWDVINDSVANRRMPQAGCPEGVWDDTQRNKFIADFQAWKDGGFQA